MKEKSLAQYISRKKGREKKSKKASSHSEHATKFDKCIRGQWLVLKGLLSPWTRWQEARELWAVSLLLLKTLLVGGRKLLKLWFSVKLYIEGNFTLTYPCCGSYSGIYVSKAAFFLLFPVSSRFRMQELLQETCRMSFLCKSIQP